MTRWLWGAVLVAACGGKDEPTEQTTDETTTPQAVDCDDPAANPWLGTCVETFHAGCFDPSGSCEGTFDLTGSVSLVWDNGASVETEPDFSDPFNPGATTELIGSGGTVCSTGQTRNNEEGCASRTVYTRSSDNAQMIFCFQADGSGSVTCPDGSQHTASAAQSASADACQYGDAEPCTMSGPGL